MRKRDIQIGFFFRLKPTQLALTETRCAPAESNKPVQMFYEEGIVFEPFEYLKLYIV